MELGFMARSIYRSPGGVLKWHRASTSGTEDPEFESHQDVRFLGKQTTDIICLCITYVRYIILDFKVL
jgi:hypothetical protein